jgi:cyclophilin family peptidyl-prolyl cis-trans isomerase
VLFMAYDGLAIPSSHNSTASASFSSSLRSQPTAVLVLQTKHGDIRIRLRPDLSPESVQHIQTLTTSKTCDGCRFYRSEKDLLLQGVMRSKDLLERPAKGPCPPAFANAQQDCPKHDPQCACHGPTMTKGMVGWAGGGSGPDFFINVFDKPVDWWGQQHTVWGIVEDPESLDRIRNHILALPVKNNGGMHMLEEPFEFQMTLQ